MIPLTTFSALDFDKSCGKVVLEFYHCNTARWFAKDATGNLEFSDPTSISPTDRESSDGERISVISYLKDELRKTIGDRFHIYGSQYGISNGYPWSRGWPRFEGTTRKKNGGG